MEKSLAKGFAALLALATAALLLCGCTGKKPHGKTSPAAENAPAITADSAFKSSGVWQAAYNKVPYGSAKLVIDGESYEGDAFYSYLNSYGHLFKIEAGAVWFTILIPESECKSGRTFTKKQLTTPNAFVELAVIANGQAAAEYSNVVPDTYRTLEFTIDEISLYNSARFTFACVFADGTSISAQCAAKYEVARNNQSGTSQSGSQGARNNAKCTICRGSGICQVCYGRGGMSVTTWGQGGDNWVTCEGCRGDRKCHFCNGTGRDY